MKRRAASLTATALQRVKEASVKGSRERESKTEEKRTLASAFRHSGAPWALRIQIPNLCSGAAQRLTAATNHSRERHSVAPINYVVPLCARLVRSFLIGGDDHESASVYSCLESRCGLHRACVCGSSKDGSRL